MAKASFIFKLGLDSQLEDHDQAELIEVLISDKKYQWAAILISKYNLHEAFKEHIFTLSEHLLKEPDGIFTVKKLLEGRESLQSELVLLTHKKDHKLACDLLQMFDLDHTKEEFKVLVETNCVRTAIYYLKCHLETKPFSKDFITLQTIADIYADFDPHTGKKMVQHCIKKKNLQAAKFLKDALPDI